MLKLYCLALKWWHTKIKGMEKESLQLKSSQCCFEQRFPALGEKGFSFYYSLSSLCLTWDTRACRKFQLLLEKWDWIPRSWGVCWDPKRSEHYPICKLSAGKVCKAWEGCKQPGTLFLRSQKIWKKLSPRTISDKAYLNQHLLEHTQNTGRWSKKGLDLDNLLSHHLQQHRSTNATTATAFAMPSHGAVEGKLIFKTDCVRDAVTLPKCGRCRERL